MNQETECLSQAIAIGGALNWNGSFVIFSPGKRENMSVRTESGGADMPIKAVQQFMLGTVMNKEEQALATMKKMKAAGYDGIELCGFMIHPSGFYKIRPDIPRFVLHNI